MYYITKNLIFLKHLAYRCTYFTFQEFWFTAAIAFLYFTAFTAQLAEYSGLDMSDSGYQYWVDAQIAAGVSFFFFFFGLIIG